MVNENTTQPYMAPALLHQQYLFKVLTSTKSLLPKSSRPLKCASPFISFSFPQTPLSPLQLFGTQTCTPKTSLLTYKIQPLSLASSIGSPPASSRSNTTPASRTSSTTTSRKRPGSPSRNFLRTSSLCLRMPKKRPRTCTLIRLSSHFTSSW